MRKGTIITLFICSLLLVCACSKKDETPVVTEPDDDIDVEGQHEEELELFTYPYTGETTEAEPTNRAVAIMVNNHPQARPQSGLHEADIVFELLAEGNITRFLALYHSSLPERVGPVRSAREYYFRLAEAYDAIYVYHGAATFIDQMIREEGIDFLNGAHYDNDKQLFIRETFRVAPHNSYVLFDEVYNRSETKQIITTANHQSLPFLEDDTHIAGEDAHYVKIEYYNGSPIVEYTFNEATNTFYRYNDGEQTIDLETEIPIEVDNIFIIEADHQVIDNEGRRAIDLLSGGNGYLIQHGKVQRVEWKNDEGHIVPVKDDEIIPFVQGKTWINVVQTTPPNNVEQVQISEKYE